MKIREIMNKAVVIDSDIDIRKAAQLMSKMGIGSLVFLKNNKIKGIVTERDIIKNVCTPSKKISSIMTKKVITIDLNSILDNATAVMTSNKIKRLLVTEKGKLVGIVTATDMIANSDVLNEDLVFI
ncbi:CBS domain-containing protein [Candidatus Pacearchaeota archaeon]|nr:CBS domain-containing protein [Candidatus Pacearchaeota archaeon]|tara:strand:+ start:625 stop:1002 length:378 start_codon:yes stop_codon:yes gene_type:complete